jgi:hypothetical protein
MMHKQILLGLKVATADHIFLCESDVLYHPSHFEFNKPQPGKFHFNTNVWKWKWGSDLCIWTDDLEQLSAMSATRTTLLDFYSMRIDEIEKKGFDRHYEPPGDRINYQSTIPNLCIRHSHNQTPTKWSPEEYRNKKYAKGWRETTLDQIEGWKDERPLNPYTRPQ